MRPTDTLALALSISDVTHALSYTPPTDDARRYFEDIAPTFLLMPQAGSTLGERLGDTLARLLSRFSPVVLIGSDSPDLPASFSNKRIRLAARPNRCGTRSRQGRRLLPDWHEVDAADFV